MRPGGSPPGFAPAWLSRNDHRIEQDLPGPREVPEEVCWSIHTLRACGNVAISGRVTGDEGDLRHALAVLQLAAAEANRGPGLLEETRAACREIMAGALRDQVVVDQIQGGAGISANMNANEVIANPALELMGQAKGDYAIRHPNEDVNLGQSTNDVYPGALRLATWTAIGRLLTAMADLRQAFSRPNPRPDPRNARAC